MPTEAFQYAILRLVPRVERGECINVGVVLHCRSRRFLDARIQVDRHRLGALWPALDPDAVETTLAAIVAVITGDLSGGELASLPASERFGWVVAHSSTAIQPSEVHTGLTEDPSATLGRLFATLVLAAGAGQQAGDL